MICLSAEKRLFFNTVLCNTLHPYPSLSVPQSAPPPLPTSFLSSSILPSPRPSLSSFLPRVCPSVRPLICIFPCICPSRRQPSNGQSVSGLPVRLARPSIPLFASLTVRPFILKSAHLFSRFSRPSIILMAICLSVCLSVCPDRFRELC